MKLAYILFLFSLFQIQANTYSQNVKVTLNCKDMKMEDVLSEIERKTEFKFLYEKDVFKKNKIVSISYNKEKLSNVLDALFNGGNIDFKVVDKQIILLTKIKEKDNFVFSIKKTVEKLFQEDITGTVTSTKGEPLPGATIVVKGSSVGVSTDFNGVFRISMPSKDAILVVSYIGYETKEIVVGNQSRIKIELSESVTGLEETVVVAYGKVKKEAFTGSVGVVDVASVANQGNILNVDHALQGQVAGVQVSSSSGRPGSAARVRIRGSSSILGTNQPLYVVDGVPISPSTEIPGYTGFIDYISSNDATTLENEGFNNDLGFLDFNNIESISILKDATATAIYGSRAAAGVVIITTKSGSKASKPQFELSITQRSNITQKIDVLNTSQYEEIYTDAIQNYVNSGGVVPTSDSFALGILNGTEINRDIDTDWQDLAIRKTSQTSNYAFSVRGASEKGSYYSSLSLQNDNGAVIGDKLSRYAFGLNLKQNLKDNLSFFSNLNLGRLESDYALNGLYSTLEAATFIRPDATPYNEDGSLIPQIGDMYNPLSSKERRVTTTNFSMVASVGLEYEPIENLFLKTTGILQHINAESYSFYPSFTQSGVSTNGRGNLIDRATLNPSIETTLTYDFSVGKSNANILIGNTFQNEKTETNSYYGENFPNDDTLTGISYAGESLSAQQAITESTLVSFFSRFIYDFDNKYLLSFGGRIDGSSKFGENNRWASFPSFGIGWNIHREKFAENWNGLNFLKLRTSIGQSGNVTFDPNQSFSLFGALNSTLGVYDGNTGVVPLRIGNPDLKWEITTQKDFGIEFAVLDNKIKGEIGYYIKDTKDVLYQTELPSSSGLYTVISNLGDTQNSGYELTLNFNILDSKDLKWNLGFNAATAKSKIIRLNSSYKDEFGGVSLNGLYFKEGQALGLIRGHVAKGLFQTQEEIDALNSAAPDGLYQASLTGPGDIYFADLDGDGVVNTSSSGPDVTNIGSIEPDFFGGINTNINYKGLSLNVFANYSVGNDIYWKAGENTYSYTSLNDQGNKELIALDRWTPENTDAKYPRAVYRTNLTGGNQNNRISSLYVLKGDYLRIKTVTLGYNLPKEVLETINFQGLYIYLTATNLFTLTKYPGTDPEFSNSNSFRTPVDNNKYPVTKQIVAGVRLTF
ncbi:SusC/RagA family TonB-linked outer membrane protein [Mariniflexile sp.]|uniref:SusC/RagA family TonB-linked outer membrane protein n=1 Tax=Mariniflexile sp. TaxID=1979402 RepID=UPI0035655148